MNLFISSFNRWKNERIFILVVVLVVLFVIFRCFSPKTNDSWEIDNDSFWTRKTFTNEKHEVLIVGDSRVFRGVSPVEMNSVLPELDIFNIGYGSAGYGDLMYQQIEKKLDYDAKDPLLILGVTPHSLTQMGYDNWHLWGLLKTTREERIERKYFREVFNFFHPFTLTDIQNEVKKSWPPVYQFQEFHEGGWVATYNIKPWPEAALASYKTIFKNNQVKDEHVDLLSKNVKKWTEKGVKVFAFRPPTTDKMIALEDSISGFNEEIVVNKLCNAGATWLKFDHHLYESYDGSHLQKESAMVFSKDLAIEIKKNLP